MKRLKRWLRGPTAMLVLYAAVALNPSLLFAHELRVENTTLHSRAPLPPEARAILEEARARASRSPYFDERDRYDLYLCDTPGLFAFFVPWAPDVGAVSLFGATGNVFIRPANIAKDRLIGPNGKEVPGARTLTKLLQIPVVAYRLVKIIQETGAQILHTQTELVFGSGLAARWTNVRSIYMVQNTPLKASEKWVWDIIVRLLDKMADRILVCSNDVRTEFLERGVSSQKLTMIYNGIDTDYFSPAGIDTREKIRAEFLRGSNQYIVGMMGRLHVSKGIETFLHAAALIRKERRGVRFLIVGTIAHAKHASYEQGLRNLATQLGLADCVTFAGFRDDVPQVLSSFDVFVFPSLREPFGLALAEAISIECSVVASDSGGVPEFVTSSLIGCLIPPNNPAGFAQATLKLLADPSDRKRMGQAARRHIEMNFSIDKQVQATERVYEEVVNS